LVLPLQRLLAILSVLNPCRIILCPAPRQQLTKTQHHDKAFPQYATLRRQHWLHLQEMKHKSNGMMDRNFKFPPSQIQAQVVPPVPSMQSPASKPESEADSNHATEENETPVTVVPPSSVEVPPPPPIEKESIRGYLSEEGDEEVGKTVEIDLRSYKATSQDSSGHNDSIYLKLVFCPFRWSCYNGRHCVSWLLSCRSLFRKSTS